MRFFYFIILVIFTFHFSSAQSPCPTPPLVPDSIGALSCGPGTVTLKVRVPAGHTADWYSAAVDGTLLKPDSLSHTLIDVQSSTTVYAVSRDLATGCVSARIPVVATINAVPAVADSIGALSCGPGTVTLKVKVPAGHTADWYSAAVDGTLLKPDSLSHTLFDVQSSTTVYAVSRDLATGCVSARIPVVATINAVPAVADSIGALSCGPGTVTLKVKVPAGHTADWYSAAVDGTLLKPDSLSHTLFDVQSSTTVYAVSRDLATGCVSARIPVVATINAVPAVADSIGALSCGPGTVTLKVRVPAGHTADWYSAAVDGTLLKPDSLSHTLFDVQSSTTVYAVSRDLATGCVSARIPVVATINAVPAVADSIGALSCGPGTVTLKVKVPAGHTADWYSAAVDGTLLKPDSLSHTLFDVQSSTTVYAVSRDLATGCVSARIPVVATINAVPAVADSIGALSCGPGTVTLKVRVPAGHTADWYSAAVDGTLLKPDSLSHTLIDVQSSTTVYAVSRDLATGCVSARIPVVATINAVPAVADSIGALSCGPGTVTLKVRVPAGYTADWYSAAVDGTLLKPDSLSHTLIDVQSSTTVYAVSRDLATGCVSARIPVVATINAVPAVADSIGALSCGPGTVTLKVRVPAGHTADWYSAAVDGTLLKPDSLSHTLIDVQSSTTVYAVSRDLATGCVSARIPVVATINAVPAVADSIGALSCGPGTVTLKVKVPAGHTADWYSAAVDGTLLKPDSLSHTLFDVQSSTTVYAVSRDLATGCVSARIPVVATINAVPAVADSIGALSCGPGTVILKVRVPAGHTADWYSAAVDGTLLKPDSLSHTLFDVQSSTTVYAVSRDLATGCVSARIPVVATINAVPAVADSIGALSCGPGTVTLKVRVPAGHTADWYSAAVDGTLLKPDSLSHTLIDVQSSTTVYAVSRDLATGCVSARIPVVATINAVPAVADSIGALSCGPGTVTLKVRVPAGHTADWYSAAVDGTLLKPDSLSHTLIDVQSSTTVYAISRDLATGCVSARIPVVATINVIPEAPLANDTARCQPGVLQLTAISRSGFTVDWFSTSSGGNVLTGGLGTSLFNTPGVSINTIFYAQARNLTTGCVSAARTPVLARIDALSVSGTITGAKEVCSGVNNTPLQLSGQRGDIQWQVSTDNILFNDIVGANQPVFNAVDLTNSTFYRVKIKNGVCDLVNSAPLKMIVSQPSASGVITGMKAVCAEKNETVLKVAGTNGLIQWQSSINRTLFTDIPNENSDSLQTLNLLRTTYYRVVVKNGSCVSSASAEVTMTVNALPQAPVTQDGSRCGTGQIILRAFPPTGISNVIDWYLDSIPKNDLPIKVSSNIFVTPDVIGDIFYWAQTRNRVTGCVSKTRVAALAEIIPYAKTGTVSGDTIVCAGINQVGLKISGQEGRIQWQMSTDNINFSDIINAKTDSLTVFNLDSTHYYRVLLNADNGCNPSITDTFKIVAPKPSFAGSINGVKEVCAGADSIQLNLTGFIGEIQWQSSADSLSFSDISLANDSILAINKLSQSTFYRVKLKSGICTPDTGEIVKIIVNELPIAPESNDVINCKIGPVELNASVPIGITSDWYAISTGGNILNRGKSTSSYVTDTLSSSVDYFVEARNLITGCLSSSRTKITALFDPAAIPVISGDPGLCNGDSISLKADQNYGLKWFYNGDTLGGLNTQSIVIRKFGDYKVLFTNKSGCSNESETKIVLGYPDILGDLTIPSKTDICDGYPFLLSASGSYGYQWYKNGVKIQDSISSSLYTNSGGVYTVQYISDKGCKIMAPDSIKLRLIKSPDAKYTIGTTTCINIPVEFVNKSIVTESGNVIYKWEFGNGKTDTGFVMNHVYSKPGLYMTKLVVTPTSCLMLADTALMYVKIESPLPAIRYPAVNAVLNKAIAVQSRDFGAKYLWSPPTGLTSTTIRNPETRLTQEQDYRIAITTSAGCTTTDSLLVRVFRENDIMVPEGFSPNADGQNDRLYPFLIGIKQMNMFRVYDRWGNLIFDNKQANASTGWEGFYNGNPLPAGPYVWMAEGVDVDDKVIRRTGSVVLIR